YQKYVNLKKATACILKIEDTYKIYQRLSGDFAKLYEETEDTPFEGREECMALSKECEEKAKELEPKLPKEKVEESRTVTTTTREREERARAAGHGKKKITKTKLAVTSCCLLVLALLVSYKVAPTRYYIAGLERAIGLNKYAMESYAKLGDYKDSQEKMKEARYAYADLLGESELDTAREMFDRLAKKQYKDSAAKKTEVEKKLIDKSSVGDKVYFGKYEWVILDKKDGEALLAKESCLKKYTKFHETDQAVTWETSNIRAFLNGEFVSNSFTEDEKNDIIPVKQLATENKLYKTSAGKETQDLVYLMDTEEYEVYRDILGNRGKVMRLRTPGKEASTTAYVSYRKEIVYYGIPVNDPGACLRPIIRVKY
nr:DUF6273 domain-containing protein [Eubacterium sp.]